MGRWKIRLPRVAEQFLGHEQWRWCRQMVRIFHRWMSEHNLVLSDLTPAHIDHFWAFQRSRGLADSTYHARRCRLHKYLYWLSGQGELRFVVEPPRLWHMRGELPEQAERFLAARGRRRLEPGVRNLHEWLTRKGVALGELTPAHIEAFLRKPIGVELEKTSRDSLHRDLEPYLLWLHDQRRVPFRDARHVRRSFALPVSARNYLDTLRPVRKPSTCSGVATDLRDLHAWMAAQGVALAQLDRTATERWLKSMADRGLGPTTRGSRIFRARRYLDWLAERGAIEHDPDDLLRHGDLPKVPSYLPRPFPVEADRQMQRRLLARGDILGQALVLMRRTGLRIGELVRLDPRCLETDHDDNAMLKVPLGKLDNERLVPLDDHARSVLESLQRACPRGAPLLLEPNHSRNKLLERLGATLKEAAAGLDVPGPIVSHRLRHTYATELLNAGMSLVAIMKLLGHRSFRMTMRYAAITHDTVARDYHAAMARISAQYDVPQSPALSGQPDPQRMLSDVITWLRNNARKNQRTDRLVKRLYKLRDDLTPLLETP